MSAFRRVSQRKPLIGAIVPVLLGSPKYFARRFKKPLCRRHFSHFDREIDGRFCPVKPPKLRFDAQRVFLRLSSAAEDASTKTIATTIIKREGPGAAVTRAEAKACFQPSPPRSGHHDKYSPPSR